MQTTEWQGRELISVITEKNWWTDRALRECLYAEGLFPRIAGAAKEKKSVKTGKATEAATWSDGVKVEAGDDIVLVNGFAVEWNTTETVRSCIIESGATINQSTSTPLKIGASTFREFESKNVLLKVSPTSTWGLGGRQVEFKSTAAGTGLIWFGGKKGGGGLRTFKGSSTYRIEEDPTEVGEVTVQETCSLETNNSNFECTAMLCTSTGSLTLGTSTFKISAALGGNIWSVAVGTTFSGASSTIELTNTGTGFEKTFAGGGKTYGTVAIAGHVKITGANKFAVLKDNTKGNGAGKGLKLEKGVKQIVTIFEDNGTSESPALLESSEAGKAAELEITAEQETTGNLNVKDITVLKGVWYLPNGKDEGGNKIVKPTESFTVVFGEGKPAPPSALEMML